MPPCCPKPQGAVYWTAYFAGAGASHYNSTTGVAKIDAGSIVYLKQNPAFPISLLIVEGSLVFDHCFDGTALEAACILVIDNGVIQIGKSNLEFPYTATIKLRTWPFNSPPPEIAASSVWSQEIKDALSDRGLVVANGGTLRLYGKDRGESWTKLAQTAGIGATTLTTISSALPWSSGDEFVITSTDYDQSQAETRILSPPINGQLEFSTGLSHMHYGAIQNFAPAGVPPLEIALWNVDERAEIGLLNRNVKILGEQSTPSGADPENFGHVFFYRDVGAALPNVEISWVEFRDLGIAGKLARYPVHFHMLKDPGTITNFIEYSSIREGHNRGLVIHDSQSVRVESNVVYDVVGYGIYVEDEATVNCEILENLSLKNRKLELDVPIPFFDKDPSNIVLRSLKNRVEGNAAAGSYAYGIYLELSKGYDPVGMVFSGNSAHSCRQIGIFEDDEVDPSASVTFAASNVWKCREHGMWIRSVGDYVVDGLVAADCRSGFYPASLGVRDAGEGHQILNNGLFVGETANLGEFDSSKLWEYTAQRSLAQDQPNFPEHELTWDTLNGVEIYDGIVEVQNCRFAEFKDRSMGGSDKRWAAGLTQVAKKTTWINDPRNVVRTLSWGNYVDRRVYFRTPPAGQNQIAFTTIVDETNCFGHGSNVMYLPNTPFLTAFQNSSTFEADAGAPGLNGYYVPLNSASYGQLALRLNTSLPLDPLLDTTFWRRVDDPGGAYMEGAYWRCDTVPTSTSAGGGGSYVFPVVVEVEHPSAAKPFYRMAYKPGLMTGFPASLTLWYRFAPAESRSVYLEIPYDSGSKPGGEPFGVGYWDENNNTGPVTHLSDLAALLSTTQPQAWAYYTKTTGEKVLSLKVTSLKPTNLPLLWHGTETHVEIVK